MPAYFKPLIQIVGDRIAMGPGNTAWHFLQGTLHHVCVCGARVKGAWREATSGETRCPACVQVLPWMAEG